MGKPSGTRRLLDVLLHRHTEKWMSFPYNPRECRHGPFDDEIVYRLRPTIERLREKLRTHVSVAVLALALAACGILKPLPHAEQPPVDYREVIENVWIAYTVIVVFDCLNTLYVQDRLGWPRR